MALLLSAVALATAGCGGGRDPILGANGATAIVVPVVPVVTFVPPVGAVTPGTCTAAGPKVTESFPINDPTNTNPTSTSTTGVANSGKSITATFDQRMNGATINANSFTLAPAGGAALIPASVSYDVATQVATLTTAAALVPATSYTAVIQGAITNAEGTTIGCNYVWNFRTAVLAAAAPLPPALGGLSTFAIASAGGITNGGATKINGNVVLDPNQTCNAAAVGAGNDFGANCNAGANKITNNAGDTVITQIHPDTTTADAVMAELRVKWNSLSPAGLSGATVLGCGTIGTAGGGGVGLGCALKSILPPGTYISATNSTIDVAGDLTLDGGPNDVWVFQAPSTLITATNSRIILTGGAKASNVSWFVGSSATLGTGTTFQGSVLASASISMLLGTTSCGRLLAGAEAKGQFSFLANTVSVPGHPNASADCK
jgi:Ice-binding-like/Bacterial Ig-like domain